MLEKTIILDGFSKTYAMTGWRMGYGVMPEWLVDAVNKLMVNSNSCTASFTQRAGIAALYGTAGWRRHDGGRVPPPPRRILRRAEPDSRLPLRPAGRRVLRLRQRDRHGHEFQGTRRLSCCTKPASPASNGAAFGEYGDGYIRFSYANSHENLMHAVERNQDLVEVTAAPPKSTRGIT